ncbi:MAG: hypothetical protein ACYC6Y_26240 [Thermoguttaceae bacterium]
MKVRERWLGGLLKPRFNFLEMGLLAVVLGAAIVFFTLQSVRRKSAPEPIYTPEQTRALAEPLRPVDVADKTKIRIGRKNDGGYIMIDEEGFEGLYGYGIGHDMSFETDFVARWPVAAYLYDHTIEALPAGKHSELLHWKKEGIAEMKLPNLNSLAAHVAENGDTQKQNLVLKMDVEGAEWRSLLATDDQVLRQFRQVILELHGLAFGEESVPYEVKLAVLEKIRNSFHIVHVHGNNFGPVYVDDHVILPDTLEVTCLRKDPDVVTRPSQTRYPTAGLDWPNNGDEEDIILDKEPFVPSGG